VGSIDDFVRRVAKEFGGRAFVAGEDTKRRRREYLARLEFFKGQNVAFERGRQARDKANEALKRKVAKEFTPEMTRWATDRNIARIRKAQHKANKAVLSKTLNKTVIQAVDRDSLKQATDQDIAMIINDSISREIDHPLIEYDEEWI